MRKITQLDLENFRIYLIAAEKSKATVEKYMRDVQALYRRFCNVEITRSTLIEYKEELIERYAPASVNSMLSSHNAFFDYMKWNDLTLKTLKIQKQVFASSDTELTKEEYQRLLSVAKEKRNERLFLIMQTVCYTGLRVSELQYVTVESLASGSTCIANKGKRRTVFYPRQLCIILENYAKKEKIKNGAVFVTKKGSPVHRSNIWKSMKKMCKDAGVSDKKVFPHNLRHLFARAYYSTYKDISRLADLLGHSNVNTTRIYTMESGEEHRKQIQSLGLLSI